MFGADLNKTFVFQETPLIYALKAPSTLPSIIELLLPDSDLFRIDTFGKSAFDYIIINAKPELPLDPRTIIFSKVLHKLLDVPVSEKPRVMTHIINQAFSKVFMIKPCSFSYDSKYLNLLDALAKAEFDINSIIRDGLSLLALSINACYSELSEKMIKKGADLKQALQQLGFNKLIYLVWKGDTQAIKNIITPRTKYLLGFKDKQGNTALHWAVRRGHLDLVQHLAAYGVGLNVKNKHGHRILTYVDKRDDNMFNVLRDAGAKNDLGETYLFLATKSNTLHKLNLNNINPKILDAQTDEGLTALHLAAEQGYSYSVDQLIKAGADLNLQNAVGNTPLISAVMRDRKDVVMQLINAGADLNVKNNNRLRAYDLANGELKALLDDAGAQDCNGFNKLIRAVGNRNEKIVDECIARKFNLDVQTDNGQTALSLATVKTQFSIGIKLIHAGADVNLGGPFAPLGWSLGYRNIPGIFPFVEELVKHEATFGSITDLMYASWKGDAEAVAKMLSADGIDLNKQDNHGRTALLFSLQMDHIGIAKLLVDAHADVNIGNPLFRAVESEKYDFVDLLLQARPDVNQKGPEHCTSLRLVIEKGLLEIAKKFIKAKADVHEIDFHGNTLLHAAVGCHGKIEVINLLLDAKVDLNVKNFAGKTALHLACQHHPDLNKKWSVCVTKLISAGADLDIRDQLGRTPLIEAVFARRNDVVDPLIEADANVNIKDNEGNSALFWAAHFENIEIVEQLIQLNDIDLEAENNCELTIVSHLCEQLEKLQIDLITDHSQWEIISTIENYNQIIQILLDAGARNQWGQTALMRSIFIPNENETSLEVQKWLSKTEDIDVTDCFGITAAMYAAGVGKLELLTLLLASDVDLLIQDIDGRTALCHAINFGKVNVIEHLLGSQLCHELQTLFPILPHIYKEDSAEKILKEIFPKLTSSQKSNALLLPFLLRNRAMAKIIMKTFTSEERRFGIEILKKTYPKANLNWIYETELEFHSSYFRVVEEVIPPAPEDVNLDRLLTMLNQITKIERGPGYLEPQRRQDKGLPITQAELRSWLELMVRRVKNKNEAFLSTPEAGTTELVEFYKKIENELRHIILKLSVPNIDLDTRTSGIFDLAIAGGYCGIRYKSEPHTWYKFLTKGDKSLTMYERIKELLQDCRVGTVEKMFKIVRMPDGTKIPIVNRPHTHNHILKKIGLKVGIPGSSEAILDKDFALSNLTYDFLLKLFLNFHSPTTEIDRIDMTFNGHLEKNGKRSSASQDLSVGEIDLWFKEQMPKDWKKNEKLAFTVDEEGVQIDYQTYIQKVTETLEAEKKHLQSLSDDDIINKTNEKIKDYLYKQFRIELGKQIDPQNWVQVQTEIQTLLAKNPPVLPKGYRSLQPEKFDEIKVHIEKLKGRHNYIKYMLTGILSNYGIVAPSNPQDLDAVKLVIENMLRQEYVDTVIRKDGLIPRETIIRILLDMQVLTAE
jgi:ankyrin repeat protein